PAPWTAPVSAVAPLVPATLPPRIDDLSPNASAADALEALLGAWGYRQTIGGELDPNLYPDAVRSISPLLVLATRGTPEMIAAIDLPAIVGLEPPPRAPRRSA